MNTPVPYPGDSYTSPGVPLAVFPSVSFYLKLLGIVCSEGIKASKGNYFNDAWVHASNRVLQCMESVGGVFQVEGMNHLDSVDGPVVFIGNHMSTLEAFVLPCLIQPRKEVTFVVKKSLAEYPFFKHVLFSRNPVMVGRQNPREDLQTVLNGGLERLEAGRSIIIFPQSTRSTGIDPALFNSIGVKLAKKAQVPIIPIALKTDAWGTGSMVRDIGPIRPVIPIRFQFGAPVTVEGNGKETHAGILEYISSSLASWQAAGV